jgi:hypothetical protein
VSTGVPTLERVTSTGFLPPSVIVKSQPIPVIEVGLKQSSNQSPSIWRQVDELLRSLGASDPKAQPTAAPTLSRSQSAQRLVAPGIAVSEQEYKARFGGLPLEDYRRVMSPEVFEAYIRFLGIIPGNPDIDIVDLASPPND